MEPTVEGARTQSGIIAAAAQDPELRWPKSRNYGCKCGRTSLAQARPPGTEFLDAETGRQKSPIRWANAHRRASYESRYACQCGEQTSVGSSRYPTETEPGGEMGERQPTA